LPPILLELLQTAGPLCSTDITPLRGYYEPLRDPLVFHRLPGCPVIRLPCSADFATGRGGFLQLLSVSLPSCCRSHPARVARRFSQFATIHAAFALRLRARPPGKHFRGHLCVYFITAQWLAITPRMMPSIGFRNLVSLLPAIQATRLLTLTSVGLSPLNTPAFAGHTTGRAQLEHPAFRLVSPQRPRKLSDNTAPCDGTPVTLPSRCGNSWMGNIRNHSGFQTFVNDRSVALSPAHQKQGPFPPPTLLGLHGCMTLSDFRAGHHPIDDV
jgi:hypothetical protein